MKIQKTPTNRRKIFWLFALAGEIPSGTFMQYNLRYEFKEQEDDNASTTLLDRYGLFAVYRRSSPSLR